MGRLRLVLPAQVQGIPDPLSAPSLLSERATEPGDTAHRQHSGERCGPLERSSLAVLLRGACLGRRARGEDSEDQSEILPNGGRRLREQSLLPVRCAPQNKALRFPSLFCPTTTAILSSPRPLHSPDGHISLWKESQGPAYREQGEFGPVYCSSTLSRLFLQPTSPFPATYKSPRGHRMLDSQVHSSPATSKNLGKLSYTFPETGL